MPLISRGFFISVKYLAVRCKSSSFASVFTLSLKNNEIHSIYILYFYDNDN